MKNSIKAITATVLITILSSGNLYAQDAYINASAKTPYSTTAGANTSNNSSVAINPLVSAKFSTLFPQATNQQWALNNNSSWVSFLNNGRKASASFTSKGKMNYVITDCAMEQLPGSFRKTISKEYASYNLYNAIEIKAYDAVAYQVVLENASTYITLKFTSDGIEEIQQLKKTVN